MSALVEFLFPAPAPRRALPILKWWESRRLGYNAIVGSVGLVSLGFTWLMGVLPPGGHGGIPPLAVVAVGLAANVCYTIGPVVEIAIENLWGRRALPTGPTLFRMGLTFSVGLVSMPVLISLFDYAVRIAKVLF
jgi:hypothetical protein